MIGYLDTSSLVKLYVEEDGSSQVDDIVRSSEVTATSIVAYAEARAAFARRYREKAFTSSEYHRIKKYFEKDWNSYLILNLTREIVRLAGDLAEKHALRGFDSIHLASALSMRRELSAPIVFSCFDDNLQKASELENLIKFN
ncbi:MAG: type II toxin-antitoxin system VapC family toxin [Desulfobacterales bacterium]|nr:type II toxin-antitoxin system VapC family toxin [Desulfobacterales bacterium]